MHDRIEQNKLNITLDAFYNEGVSALGGVDKGLALTIVTVDGLAKADPLASPSMEFVETLRRTLIAGDAPQPLDAPTPLRTARRARRDARKTPKPERLPAPSSRPTRRSAGWVLWGCAMLIVAGLAFYHWNPLVSTTESPESTVVVAAPDVGTQPPIVAAVEVAITSEGFSPPTIYLNASADEITLSVANTTSDTYEFEIRQHEIDMMLLPGETKQVTLPYHGMAVTMKATLSFDDPSYSTAEGAKSPPVSFTGVLAVGTPEDAPEMPQAPASPVISETPEAEPEASPYTIGHPPART